VLGMARAEHSGNPKISDQVFQVHKNSDFRKQYSIFVRTKENPTFRGSENLG
jgi:hypothetical protein